MVGSSPQLVIYDRGSNTNMIRGEIAETEGLDILSARAGRIKVAGGDFISTGFRSYKTTLGPSRTWNFHNLKCQGIKEITGELMKHPLQEINQELREMEMVDMNAPFPKFTGGGSVGILIGLQDVSLDPILIGTLPSGLGVYQCLFVDVWGSSIAYAG